MAENEVVDLWVYKKGHGSCDVERGKQGTLLNGVFRMRHQEMMLIGGASAVKRR